MRNFRRPTNHVGDVGQTSFPIFEWRLPNEGGTLCLRGAWGAGPEAAGQGKGRREGAGREGPGSTLLLLLLLL